MMRCFMGLIAVSLYGATWALPQPRNEALTLPASSPNIPQKIVFVHADQNIIINNQSGGNAGNNRGEVEEVNRTDMSLAAAEQQKGATVAIMDLDGKESKDLHYGVDPVLSPDGSKIAFTCMRDTLYSQIYVMSADGTNVKRVTDFKDTNAYSPAWSHDGKKIAFTKFALARPDRSPQIWVMDADGSNTKKLAEQASEPSWAPDDAKIVFASARDQNFQIYVMNADGSKQTRLTKGKGEDSEPSWAPDGSAIVFVSDREGARHAIFMMNPDGSNQQRLAFSKRQEFCFPTWSLDGKYIIFSTLLPLGAQYVAVGEERPRCEIWSGEYQIYALTEDGKTKQITPVAARAFHPSVGPGLAH